MLPQHVLIALVAAVSAAPLNINLGAYSPALVVGDGEIKVGGEESASELMATLASGAAAGAEGAAQPAKRGNLARAIENLITKRAPAPQPAPQPDASLAAVESAMQWIKRDLEGFNAALTYAREAQKDQPKVELGTPNSGIGIVVNPGVNVPADSAAAGSPPAEHKAKRAEVVDEDDAPKMTLVAITEV